MHKEYVNYDNHEPIIRPVYINVQRIWNKEPKTVSEDLTPRVMKILNGGHHKDE